MPLETLVQANAKTVDKAAKQLLSGFADVEASVFKELRDVLFGLSTTKGKITNDADAKKFLLSLEKKIMGALDNSPYKSRISQYLTAFDSIDDNIKAMHLAENKISVSTQLINSVKRTEVQNTIDNLLGSGVSRDFVNPVKEALYRHITLGGNIGDAENLLRSLIISKPDELSTLHRYVGQVSRDGISQYEGSINQRIADVYELNAGRYVGSLITDSRPQCIRWVKKAIIMLDDLDEEIKWANAYGTGMIKSTNSSNFFINRGGWNCRHQFIPTRKKIVK